MISVAEVSEWSGLTKAPDTNLYLVVSAVNDYVNSLPSIDRDETGAWGQTTFLGAIMLASRVYRRRNSINGIETFSEQGTTYVSRYDSDIARLLHIDTFRKPVIG